MRSPTSLWGTFKERFVKSNPFWASSSPHLRAVASFPRRRRPHIGLQLALSHCSSAARALALTLHPPNGVLSFIAPLWRTGRLISVWNHSPSVFASPRYNSEMWSEHLVLGLVTTWLVSDCESGNNLWDHITICTSADKSDNRIFWSTVRWNVKQINFKLKLYLNITLKFELNVLSQYFIAV